MRPVHAEAYTSTTRPLKNQLAHRDLKKEVSIVIIALVLGAFVKVSPCVAQSVSDKAATEILFYISLEKLDDRIPALYTSALTLTLYNPYNQTFGGILLYQSPAKRSEVEGIVFPSSPSSNPEIQVWSSGSRPPLAFYNQEFTWALSTTGEFPLDSLTWAIVIGLSSPLDINQTSTRLYLDSTEGLAEISSKWIVGPPEISSLADPTGFFRQRGVTQKINELNYFMDWYVLEITFTRQGADIERFTFLYWLPALGLLSLFVTTWIATIVSRRRNNRSPISFGNALTLFLGSAFFAFPFVLTIGQYAPPHQVTLVEYLFYLDLALAFVGAGLAVVSHSFLPPKPPQTRACDCGLEPTESK